MSKITNEAISTKLDMIHDLLREHVAKFEEHVKEDQIVAKMVDRLDQAEQRRTWHVRAIWATILAALMKHFWG